MELFKTLPANLNIRTANSGMNWQIQFFNSMNNANVLTLPFVAGAGSS